ncbi:MAG: alpha-galactosidase [Chloroflexi bacterium]|nr:alpha-galactosidase [Chloroflexota bacterium]
MQTEESLKTVPAPASPWDVGAPVINGPAVTGASPAKEFLYSIPTVGERRIRFSAEGLPAGLTLDPTSGRITGRVGVVGDYSVLLRAENVHGKAEKTLRIVIGERSLALTPPMGWNSWNCFRSEITADKTLRVADGMVSSGMAARGYTYVNLDSGWQSDKRGGRFGAILPHSGFPDMHALCARVHALGLKIGIYSGPYVVPWGTEGCGSTSGLVDTRFLVRLGIAGKYVGLDKHEAEDVAQWADWGIDYLKYDWADTDMENAARMSQQVARAPRDMVYSVTVSVRLADAPEIVRLCNLWRSNDDTFPTWASVLKNGFGNEQWNRYIGPGHWFDLDMTAIAPRDGQSLSETEKVTCFTCWAMRPSPLLLDVAPDRLDAFTLSLLCNEEVLAVNQDWLGMPSAPVVRKDGWEIQVKPLGDGDCAVGFYNLSEADGVSPELVFAHVGLAGEVRVRDLWAKQDLAGARDRLAVPVESHGAKLFRVGRR